MTYTSIPWSMKSYLSVSLATSPCVCFAKKTTTLFQIRNQRYCQSKDRTDDAHDGLLWMKLYTGWQVVTRCVHEVWTHFGISHWEMKQRKTNGKHTNTARRQQHVMQHLRFNGCSSAKFRLCIVFLYIYRYGNRYHGLPEASSYCTVRFSTLLQPSYVLTSTYPDPLSLWAT